MTVSNLAINELESMAALCADHAKSFTCERGLYYNRIAEKLNKIILERYAQLEAVQLANTWQSVLEKQRHSS